MGVRVVILVVLLLLVAPAAADAQIPYWSVGKVLRRIEGASIRVGTRRVRLDGATTLCSGEGRSVRRGGVRMWRHFRCTYTLFTGAFVDRDLDFRLHVRTATRFAISDAHWVGGR